MGYAGRLDPLARGLLLVLKGDGVKNQKSFELEGKIYEFDLLFGFATDTHDIMGMLTSSTPNAVVSLEELEKELPRWVGKRNQRYPAYSSARYKGKQLFHWAREGKLNEVYEWPTINTEIHSLKITSSSTLCSSCLLQSIKTNIGFVEGDFRQEKIVDKWNTLLTSPSFSEKTFTIVKMEAVVSSGTYIRSLCSEIGELFKVGGIAFDIYRTQVSSFSVQNAFKFVD
jgi:tRNA pseudouridine(55) synthase